MKRLALLTFLLAGCAAEEASTGVQLLIPDQVAVDWDESFDGAADGLVALVPVDVMVYDGDTGQPVHNAPLVLRGLDPGVALVPVDDVLSADPDLDEEVLWDAWRDRYVQLEAGAADVLDTRTDDTGLARVYVLVDRFGQDLEPVAVGVALPSAEETLVLAPS